MQRPEITQVLVDLAFAVASAVARRWPVLTREDAEDAAMVGLYKAWERWTEDIDDFEGFARLRIWSEVMSAGTVIQGHRRLWARGATVEEHDLLLEFNATTPSAEDEALAIAAVTAYLEQGWPEPPSDVSSHRWGQTNACGCGHRPHMHMDAGGCMARGCACVRTRERLAAAIFKS